MTASVPASADSPFAAADPRVRFRDLLAAEWTKLWSLRSTRWVLGVGALLLIAGALQKSWGDYNAWPTYRAPERAHFDPMTAAFSAISAILLVVGSGVIGALTIVGEYATGLIRTTFSAVPARHRVMLAKVAVTATVMLVAGAVVSLSTFAVSQSILSGRGIAVSVEDPGVPRVLLANAMLAPLAALVGLGIGALLRHTAGTVVTVIVLLVILPMTFKPTVHQWANDLYMWFPFYDWAHCLSLRHPPANPALPAATGSWTAFAAWAMASVGVTVAIVSHRDV